MPCTQETAMVIGDVIIKAIERYEPRVSVEKVNIIAKIEQQQYDIDINLKIISLQGKDFKFKRILTKDGFGTN